MNNVILSIKNLYAGYYINSRYLEILKNINLDIEEGKTYAIVGQSGSGKSTLALGLMGLISIDNGKIEKGNPNVAIGAYALVIFILGLTDKLKNFLDPFKDIEGLNLEKQHYPKRIRYKKNEGCLF